MIYTYFFWIVAFVLAVAELLWTAFSGIAVDFNRTLEIPQRGLCVRCAHSPISTICSNFRSVSFVRFVHIAPNILWLLIWSWMKCVRRWKIMYLLCLMLLVSKLCMVLWLYLSCCLCVPMGDKNATEANAGNGLWFQSNIYNIILLLFIWCCCYSCLLFLHCDEREASQAWREKEK